MYIYTLCMCNMTLNNQYSRECYVSRSSSNENRKQKERCSTCRNNLVILEINSILEGTEC